jgi:hypothetical protein
MPLSRYLLAAALLAALPAAAQPTTWTALGGPSGADLNRAAVAADGIPFAVSDTELFRYDVAAGRWALSVGTFTGSFHDVATGPGNRVWAGTGGVFRSLNGGQSWTWFPVRTSDHGGVPATILHVAVGPDATVYASRYRSTDDGASWPEMSVFPVAMAFVGATAYAADFDGGLYRSTNSGASWALAGLAGTPVVALAASGPRLVAASADALWTSTDGTTWTPTASLAGVAALAATADGAFWAATPDGLYRSTNGTTWPGAPTHFAGRALRDVAANGAAMLALVDGVPYRSTDSGATWAEVSGGLTLRHATDAIADRGRLAVAALGAGPFVSDDAGATWAPWRDGLGIGAVRAFVVDPGTGRVLAHAHDGIYHAPAVGGTWAASTPASALLLDAIAGDDAGRFYVASRLATLSGELHRSTDGGATWTLARALPSEAVVALDGGGGVVAAAVTATFGGTPHLLVSTDGGATWVERPHPTGDVSQHFVDDFGRIYVGDANRLRRSDDGGATWTPLGSFGIAATRAEDVLAEAGGVVCLGTTRGVYCSTDDGTTFTPASDGLPAAKPVVALVRDDSPYVALTQDDGAFGSGTAPAVTVSIAPQDAPVVIGPDGGTFRFTVTVTNTSGWSVGVEVWTAVVGAMDRSPVLGPVDFLLPAFGTVTRTVTQRVPAEAPAGAYTYLAQVGVFDFNVFDTDAFALVKQPAAEGALAASRGATGTSAGWSASEAGSAADEAASRRHGAGLPGGSALSAVQPNPFEGHARFTLDVAAGQRVTVAVFDALGRRVATLYDGEVEEGTHAFALDGHGLPAGLYVVRATGETFTEARRAVRLR